MNLLNLQTISIILVLLLVSVVSPNADADQIRIEFSGVFSECIFLCNGDSPVESLIDQPFQGVIEIPDIEESEPPELVSETFPYQAEKGLYTFGSDSFMSITTGVPEFDLFERTPIKLIVNNCIELTCPFIQDYVRIYVAGDSYGYILTLAAPHPPFESISIPQISELQGLIARMEIVKQDFSQGVSTHLEKSPVIFNVSGILKGKEENFILNFLPSILSNLKKKKLE